MKGESPDTKGRRKFITAGASLALAGVFSCLPNIAHSSPTKINARNKKIVIIGGGFSGAKVASRLLTLLPDSQITIIEQYRTFIPGPSVMGYLFSDISLASISYNYKNLQKAGVNVIHDRVVAIDPDTNIVSTSTNKVQYDTLVLATGISLAVNEINGLADHAEQNYCIYDRTKIAKLRDKLQNFNKGSILVSVPSSALSCPPAPYEYCLLLAEYMRKHKRKGVKIVLLDTGITPQPRPLSDVFYDRLDANSDFIEYVPAAGDINGINVASKTVSTTYGDDFNYDLLSIIPKQTVASFVDKHKLGSEGDNFTAVNLLTMQTTKYQNIYAPGDIARTPYGKSAYSADVNGEMCARAIAISYGAKITPTEPVVEVACFPYVDYSNAMSMRVQYRVSMDKEGLHLRSYVKTTKPSAQNVQVRQNWLDTALKTSYRF